MGYSKNTFALLQQIYNQNGQPIEGLFNDANRDGKINTSDVDNDKRSDPDWFLGFSTDFSYKKISMGFVLRASFDNYVYNQNYATDGSLSDVIGSNYISNVTTSYLASGFKGGNALQFLSNYYLQNASFLKMDNLHFGYDFGKPFRNSSATLRLTIGIQNVFVITKYTGVDPEVSNGIDNNQYPRPRTFSIGLNLNL